MNAMRTPWWHYVIGILLGVLCGMGVMSLSDRTGVTLAGAPWVVDALLFVLGVVVLALAWQVRVYARTDPRKRQTTLDPRKAVYALMLSKSLGIAGAVLAGWYGGQILLCLGHLDAEFYRQVAWQCAVAGVLSLLDMVAGIIGERWCQLPPSEGAEHPRMREAERQRQMAGAAVKTSHE